MSPDHPKPFPNSISKEVKIMANKPKVKKNSPEEWGQLLDLLFGVDAPVAAQQFAGPQSFPEAVELLGDLLAALDAKAAPFILSEPSDE
jgi:hypothetical protein